MCSTIFICSTIIRSIISDITSLALVHFSAGLCRLSSHAGRSIMSVWHTHAVGFTQMAASRIADTMSACMAIDRSVAVVARLSGHGGLQSAHASGLGSPLSREFSAKYVHFLVQSDTSLHVIDSSVFPFTCVSGTSVRGYSLLESAMLIPVTKSESSCSTSMPQRCCDQPVTRPVHPTTLIVALAAPELAQPVLP